MSAGVAAQSAVGAPIKGLKRNTVYHYRLVAVDYDGITVGRRRTFRTAGARASVKVTVAGRRTILRLGLPRRTAVSATILRLTVVKRGGKRTAAYTKLKRIRAKAQAAGPARRRSLGRLAPGRYRVKVRLRSATGVRNVVRTFRVSPRRPKLTSISVRKGRHLVSLRLYSRARITGWVQRLRGGAFLNVRRVPATARSSGERRIALPPRLPKGRYRVKLAINEGGRRTTRAKRFRVAGR
jgi:hypothetical protein